MESKLNKIKARRKILGFTQKEIANRIGVTVSQYNYFENERRNLSFPKFERLLLELGLNMILTEYDFTSDDLINLDRLKHG